MLTKNDKEVFVFENLSKYPQIVHGFSTKTFGNLQPNSLEFATSLQKFSTALGISPENIIRKEQVHGKKVAWVGKTDLGKIISETDGLLTKETEVYLMVKIADCVPILLYDRQKNVVGIVHAGWRGIFHEIIDEAVKEMVTRGSNPKDIFAGIGPSIRVCCYEVGDDLAKQFAEKFSDWSECIIEKNGKKYLDLPLFAIKQLQKAGIPKGNIEDGEICTADNEEFYSYRKGDKDARFAGLIGRKEV